MHPYHCYQCMMVCYRYHHMIAHDHVMTYYHAILYHHMMIMIMSYNMIVHIMLSCDRTLLLWSHVGMHHSMTHDSMQLHDDISTLSCDSIPFHLALLFTIFFNRLQKSGINLITHNEVMLPRLHVARVFWWNCKKNYSLIGRNELKVSDTDTFNLSSLYV